MNRTDAFLHHVRTFDGYGIPTLETVEDGITYLRGQFWTSQQRQGHPIHEVSYRGCFKAELPALFVGGLTGLGETVYDPFAGRGTTLIEAALRGRAPVGNDINPLAAMLCRPRLDPPTRTEVIHRLLSLVAFLPKSTISYDLPDADLLEFYHPDTLTVLRLLRRALADAEQQGMDKAADWIRMVALNRLSGHSSGFFSVYTLPPNQAASPVAQRRINAKRAQTPPARDVLGLILRKTDALLRKGGPEPRSIQFTSEPAWDVKQVADGSVSLVVTSPPFLDVIDYQADNWLRCWFAGFDPKSVPISQLACPAQWQAMVRDVLADLARVVRPGGFVAFEVGEVRGGQEPLERLVWHAADGLPFERLAVIVNGGSFTKTANIWRVNNNAKGTNTNRIVLLRRLSVGAPA